MNATVFIAIISIIILSLFSVFCCLLTSRAWRPLWISHKPGHYLHPIIILEGICAGLFLPSVKQLGSEEDSQSRGKEKREKGDNCILPQFGRWKCVCANYQNTTTLWQQHQADSVGLFWKGGKASPFPFPRQTCGVAAELSRECTTHIASAHIQRPPPPLRSISPSLSTTYMSISLPAANTVINLSVCLLQWQNQWAVLGAGVDIAAVCKARATWLIYCYTRTASLFWWRCLCFLSRLLFCETPQRIALLLSLMRKYPVLSVQSQSMGNCKQKFPQNISVWLRLCANEFGKMRGRSKLPREDPRLSSHWGKEPEAGRWDARGNK